MCLNFDDLHFVNYFELVDHGEGYDVWTKVTNSVNPNTEDGRKVYIDTNNMLPLFPSGPNWLSEITLGDWQAKPTELRIQASLK